MRRSLGWVVVPLGLVAGCETGDGSGPGGVAMGGVSGDAGSSVGAEAGEPGGAGEAGDDGGGGTSMGASGGRGGRGAGGSSSNGARGGRANGTAGEDPGTGGSGATGGAVGGGAGGSAATGGTGLGATAGLGGEGGDAGQGGEATSSTGGTTASGGASATGGVGGTTETGGVGGTTETGGVGGTTETGGAGGTTETGGAGGVAGAAGAGGGSAGVMGTECGNASDCDVARGPSPCGVWACVFGSCHAESPGCVDADGDGYGVGASCQCASLDCNDATPVVGGRIDEPCYDGPSGTDGVGICRSGVRQCIGQGCGGQITPYPEACNTEDDDCNGLVDDGFGNFELSRGYCARSTPACINGVISPALGLPLEDEDPCNGIDDDCDGAVDEDCPTCIKVAPTGDDAAAIASGGVLPFRNVQPAIDFADANRSIATKVCLAAGAACRTRATFTYQGPLDAPLTMRSGIDVIGKYESTNWSRCIDSGTWVSIAPRSGEGVLFPPDIDQQTVLQGMFVERPAADTSAAITVDGALGAVISEVTVRGTPASSNAYGVNVVNGGDAMLVKSVISGGAASVEAIGVRVVGGHVWIDENRSETCAIQTQSFTLPYRAFGVLLDSSPGSRVSNSNICTNGARFLLDQYDNVVIGAESMGVVVTGDASGVVVDHNLVTATAGGREERATLYGIRAHDCGGTSPWIAANQQVHALATSGNPVMAGIHVGDACRASVDRNSAFGRGYWPSDDYPVRGIGCKAPGPITVSGNYATADITNGGQYLAAIECTAASRVSRNNAWARIPLSQPNGCELSCRPRIALGVTGTYVDRNSIHGGCTTNFRQGYGAVWELNTVYPAQDYPAFGGGPYADGYACPTFGR